MKIILNFWKNGCEFCKHFICNESKFFSRNKKIMKTLCILFKNFIELLIVNYYLKKILYIIKF